jgi:hypothetical protein
MSHGLVLKALLARPVVPTLSPCTRRLLRAPISQLSTSNRRSSTLSDPRAAMSGEKPILLYTLGTPNGVPISAFLEELKAKHGLEYE